MVVGEKKMKKVNRPLFLDTWLSWNPVICTVNVSIDDPIDKTSWYDLNWWFHDKLNLENRRVRVRMIVEVLEEEDG